MDGDERVESIDGALNLQGDVATATLYERLNGENKVTPLRMFFRAQRGIHVIENHFTYMVGDKCLWGTKGNVEVPAVDSNVIVQHLHHERRLSRKQDAHRYYERRTRKRAERLPCAWCSTYCTERIPFDWHNIDGHVTGVEHGCCDDCRSKALAESEAQFASAVGSARVSLSLPT